jgi:flavin reductase (DIM6/NTAB) family NADH-FMN oxidoreductase RutF
MKFSTDMLTHGVYVACAQLDGKLAGFTVAWATQAGKDRILLCVGRKKATQEMIQASKAFGLSVLGKEQSALALHFGRRSSSDFDKFAGVPYHTAETGSPLLDDCGKTFDCRLIGDFACDGGYILVGKVVGMETLREGFEPMIYTEEIYNYRPPAPEQK